MKNTAVSGTLTSHNTSNRMPALGRPAYMQPVPGVSRPRMSPAAVDFGATWTGG
jgi:hypothetical protein